MLRNVDIIDRISLRNSRNELPLLNNNKAFKRTSLGIEIILVPFAERLCKERANVIGDGSRRDAHSRERSQQSKLAFMQMERGRS